MPSTGALRLCARLLDPGSIASGVIVNPVNCRGVMGAGFARAIRTHYPIIYNPYWALCQSPNPQSLLGTIQVLRVSPSVFVVNAFTQVNYGHSGRYADLGAIEACFDALMVRLKNYPTQIHSPAVGCGLGGLAWKEVRPVFEKLCQRHPDQALTIWLGNDDYDD